MTHHLDGRLLTEEDDETTNIFTYLVEVPQARDPRVTAPESPVLAPPRPPSKGPLPGHVHSLMNMQDSPAHGVLGQLTQDPGGARRVQRAVEALSSKWLDENDETRLTVVMVERR
ncbi:hypothetical protein PTSG_05445 [Salpingoeca rosetta]|uniref:Uncharacterized protein n=1 Tax=Salpingoeca rosetta (strain ATCC 50818 / BSB-021) TaxID=946362 RepID=F2UAG2_SALR5|nr:uncharacterized protein PTSG_05445 [Salpingoeca rosetta]EGD73737.1 hypothetical protein PTSG_05445 [Salpingoeca rosetta]|eukprot:XP_004994018.1 hypothetical protein PTSG_05445 [Salpingoeca rosetta]